MILENKIVKTRKPHCCVWCNGTIQKGQKCSVWVWAEGAEIQRNYSHTTCAYVAYLFKCDEDEYVSTDSLCDEIMDYYYKYLTNIFTKEEWCNMKIEQQCQHILNYETSKEPIKKF